MVKISCVTSSSPQAFRRESKSLDPRLTPCGDDEAGVCGNDEINVRNLFGNFKSLEIEIGCGKGKFITARAQANPEINFLGIDRVRKWMKRRMLQVERSEISNLQFIKTEIREFLKDLPAESVSIFHLYFPDPWPKRKHRPRRLIQADFLQLLAKKLQADGRIEIATDDADYFSHIKKIVEATRPLWQGIRESVGSRLFDENLATNYELKYRASGRALYYMELKK